MRVHAFRAPALRHIFLVWHEGIQYSIHNLTLALPIFGNNFLVVQSYVGLVELRYYDE